MPIVVNSEILVFTKNQFHTLDERVIGIVFEIYNNFGRLMNEDIYKQIIRRRYEAAGIDPIRREVEITVSYQDFWSFCKHFSASPFPRVRALRSSRCGTRISSLPRHGSVGRAAPRRRTLDRCIPKPFRR